MKLSSYLDKDLIFTNIEKSTTDEVIKEMIAKISREDDKVNKIKSQVETTVLTREHQVPTALGKGIAIPHGRLPDFDDVLVAIGVLKNPFECPTADKKTDKVKVFFMIIAAQTKNKMVLKLMAAIMKMIKDEKAIDAIVSKSDPHDILNYIKDTEIEVSERVTAEDIMNRDIQPAKLEDTLEEIATRFVVESLHGLPVVDNKGKFIGEITEKELIAYGMPKYTSLMSDLSFMTIGEPFEEYFKNEQSVTVKELYRKNPVTIDKKASIMEVSFMMVTKGNTRIYVVEKGEYFGTIYRADLIKKVLHI